MTWLHDFLANQSNAQTRDGMEIYPPIRSGPQNAIRATSPASPYARDRVEAPSNRPAARTPTLRSRAQDVVRSAPGALTAARERSVYDTTPQDLVRGAQELTGLPSLARGAGGLAALPALVRSGTLGTEHIAPGAMAVGETALGLLGPMSLPRGAARAPAIANVAEEPAQRIPNMAREIGPNGMPVAQSQPTRNSFRGGSSDLREAAALSPRPPVGSISGMPAPEGRRIVYQGGPRPLQGDTLDDAQLGTGQGASTFGRGHYVAENPVVGESYARQLGEDGRGFTHELDIPEGPYIDIFKPFSQQDPRAQEAIRRLAPQFNWDAITSEMSDALTILGRNEQRVAEQLSAEGVRGLRYLDQRSRPGSGISHLGDPTSNYVVFRGADARRRFPDFGHRAPPPTTPTGTAPFGDPRAYPQSVWEEFGSLQGGGRFDPSTMQISPGEGSLRNMRGNGASLQFSELPEMWQIRSVDVDPSLRGQGNGVRLYEDFIRRARAAGVPRIGSDVTVSGDAARVYDALRRRGYRVEKNPSAYRMSSSTSGASDGNPLYTIDLTSPPPSLQGGTPEARLRAQEQGFDTGRVLYRGLTRPYDAERAGQYQMFTTSPHEASDYAGDFPGANVVPAFVRRGRNATVDAGRANFNSISVDALPADVRVRLHPSVGATARTDEIAHAAKAAGYDSVTIRNVFDQSWGERPSVSQAAASNKNDIDALYRDLEEAGFDMGPADGVAPHQSAAVRPPSGPVSVEAVFDPRNIRSIFAAFDPAKRDSSDLLAGLSIAAPIPIAGALTQQQNTTGRPRGRPGFFGGR